MVACVEENGDFTVEAINKAACEYFETEQSKIINKSPKEIFDGDLGIFFSQALRTAVRAGKTLTIQSIADLIGNPEIQAFIFNPLFNENNEVTRIDIIGRMNLPQNIQLRKERDDAVSMLTSIFDTSSVGIVVLDRHHRIVRVNDIFVEKFGWNRTDLIGEKFKRLVTRQDYETFTNEDNESEDERRQISEIKIKRPNGDQVDVFVTTAFLELTSKRRFKIATVLDISKQKDLERVLRDAKVDAETANKAKSAFLANMSHELRTPLNAIIGFSELIKNATFGPVGNPKYEEYLTDILFSAQHLLDIINDVLDMSKIEAGKVEIHERDVDIEDLFDSVERIMHDRVTHSDLTLDVKIHGELPALFADRRWLRQMLMNLVSNSIKFSPQGNTIKMEARMLDKCTMRITVQDFGTGIEASKIKTVLEPFGQAGEPVTNTGQGTGLGLPLAKAMAEMHNGVFHLESELGKGTTIHIDFPKSRLLIDCDDKTKLSPKPVIENASTKDFNLPFVTDNISEE